MKSDPLHDGAFPESRPILPCAARTASELGVLVMGESENAGGRAGVTRGRGISRRAPGLQSLEIWDQFGRIRSASACEISLSAAAMTDRVPGDDFVLVDVVERETVVAGEWAALDEHGHSPRRYGC